MQRKAGLTAVEWEIMEAIWALGGAPSVREVLEHTFPGGEKAYTTVQTIMNNLVRKGYLASKKTGMVNFYTPVRTRRGVVRGEISHLVSRVFGGSVPALASYILRSEDLTLEELREIGEMLERRADELRRE
jgi:BlaI family penicillinase repressor